MSPYLWPRLATAVTIALGAVGLMVASPDSVDPRPHPYPSPSPSPSPSPTADPCSGSAVSIEDFVMWDSVPDGGGGGIPVRARFPCRYARMITFTTYDITARAGEDYVEEKHGVLLFPAGSTRTTLRIAVVQDDRPEPPEDFGVRLLSGAEFDDPEAIITIRS